MFTISDNNMNPFVYIHTGDPIADCFAQIAWRGHALMVIADGVHWGEKSKLAARCAVRSVIDYIYEAIYTDTPTIHSTKVLYYICVCTFTYYCQAMMHGVTVD